MKKVLTFLLMLSAFFSLAQPIHPDILKKRWSAYWIDVPGQPENSYGVYNFRKVIELPAKPSSFIVHASADNRYKLFVNGKLVSLGPARGDLFHWNFETIDIAQFLEQGKNTISAIVWNFGEQRPEAQISIRTAFILQGNTENEKAVNTDKSWKCIRDESYRAIQPSLLYTYYVSGPGELIDFNVKSNGWQENDFDDRNWLEARQIFNGLPKGVFDYSTGWMLIPRLIPAMDLNPERLNVVRSTEGIKLKAGFPRVKSSFTVPANQKVKILLDQGHLTNAYPVLEFGKGKDATVTLRYAEALYVVENTPDWRAHRQKGNRNDIEGKRFVGVHDQLVSSGAGFQQFTPLWWRTYRYLQLEIETKSEALVIEDLYGLFTGYPFELRSKVGTSEPQTEKLIDVGWRTARLCAAETYMDCPYYEQLQYVGDTRIQALVTLFNTDDDRLVRNAITQLDYSRMAEGITLSRYPTAHAQEIPTFSLWWIGMLHDYWLYRPDPGFVAGMLPGSRQVLNFFMKYQQSDGSLKDAPYWEFTDWAEGEGWSHGMAPVGADGSSSILDLQLCWAYQIAAQLEDNLGMKEYATLYRQKAEQLKQSIKERYWVPSRNLFSDTSEKTIFSQHANTLAVLTEVIKGQEARDLVERILSEKNITPATIYFKYYLHQAVAQTGLGDRYLSLLGDWRDQLANGLTTWAEISDYNKARSDCHAWGASPNIELFRIVLGIDTQAPGFSSIKIQPHLGTLTRAQGSIPHPQGEIAVSYAQVKGKWKVDISIPKNTSGIFIWKGKRYELKPGDANTFTF